jgi:hypothetical protein
MVFFINNPPRLYTIVCLVVFAFTCLPWAVNASFERRELIQGEANINADVSVIPIDDRWPYTLALCVCKNGIPTSVICGATLIHPSVALTAGRLYSLL